MKFNKIFGIIAASSLLISSLASCAVSASALGTTAGDSAANGAPAAETFRLGVMTGSGEQYAAFIAQEEGFFDKHGIKVEVTEYVAGINTVDAIANGVVDSGDLADFAAANRIGNTLHDTNLVLYATLSSGGVPVGGLYVAPEYENDLAALDGSKGWITQIGTVVEYYNWQAQTFIGVDPEKQTNIKVDSPQTGLALAQKGDAAASFVSGANTRLYEEYGWKRVAGADEIGIKTGGYLVTTKEYIAAHAETLANYLRGLKESIDFINSDLDSAAKRIEAKFGINAADFIANWRSQEYVVGFSEESAKILDKVNDWAFSQGRYPEAFNARDFIDVSAAKLAFPENVTIIK